MNKPKQAQLGLFFTSVTGKGVSFENVKQNVLKNLSESSLRFFHFERKGNTDLVLDGMKKPEPVTEILIKRPDEGPAVLVFGDEEVIVSKYTVLSLGEDKYLYYLDELPDGTWRIAHSDSIFIPTRHLEHKEVVKIHFQEVRYHQDSILPSIFDKRDDNYVPKPNEPSPFGPDQENCVDNPWIVWKRNLEGYNERVEGSPTLLREALKERLEKETFTEAEAFNFDTPELLTTDGRHLSLAWVMYYKARSDFNWERVHRFGLEKIKKEKLRNE